MDRLASMQAFVAVVDLKGFAPAARQLGVSASGMTRLIAALEQHLGARLLQRTTRSIALTDIGAQYLERARRIVADMEEAEALAQVQQVAPSGRLIVAAPLVFGRIHVAPLVSRYLKRYPEVSAELRVSDRVVNLVEEGVDVAVRIGHLPDSSLVARHVGDMQRIVVGSPRYLKARGRPQTPADLADHDLIRFGGAGPVADWRFLDRGREIRIQHPAAYISNSADVAVYQAEQGGGLAMVLSYQAADAIAKRRLQVVLADYQLPPIPIHVIYPTSRLLSAKVRAFVDTAVATTDWTFSKLGR